MDYESFVASKRRSEVATGHNPGDLNEHLFDFQHAIVGWAVRRGRAAIFADTGLGKQQPVTEPVLTPDGWKVMGDLNVGDFVIGSNGMPTKVLGVFPQGVKRVFRLELSDGTFVRAGDEHLWAVRTKTHKYRGEPFQIKTTKEIADSIHRDWQLPLINPAHMDDINLPIDPYALGVMLGDGQSSEMTYICTDNWIGDYLGWRKKSNHDSCDYVGYFTGPADVLRSLGDIGLRKVQSDTKFVPEQYIHASPKQRLELLNGLMDTDGYPMPDGGAEFSSTSRNLVESVCSLVRSLGGVARGLRECASTFTHNGEKRKGKHAWRVNLKLPSGMPMFKLPRKADKHVSPTKYDPARIIRSVVDEGIDEEQVCIMVDADDHLYITRDYIVTHNTLMQLSWADEVASHTGGIVLVLAPLAVSEQTIEQGSTFGIEVKRVPHGCTPDSPGVWITNYERMDAIDYTEIHGLVLDESSILKAHDGKTRQRIIDAAQGIPYRLSCTATPSPNDFEELGNQCEFLGVMSRTEMLATYFVNDTGDTGTWRLKGWGASKFWEWMGTWSVVLRNPSDLGFDGSRYELPPLEYKEHVVQSEMLSGELFARPAQSLMERRQAQRQSLENRCKALADVVNAESTEPWLIWCHLNDEAELLQQLIPGSVNVQGSDSPESKSKNLLGFAHGDVRVLISKPKIAGFGMNWQHCARMAFVGLDDSFEKFYQAVRRCYRFGQKRSVQVHIFTSENEGQILANIKRKEIQHHEMSQNMIEHMRDIMSNEIKGQTNIVDEYKEDTYQGDGYTVHLGDCVKWARRMDDNSIDYSLFSPPFADLFVYSNSDHDMGNCKDDEEFAAQLKFLIAELYRIIKPGRNVSFHCMNLPTTKMRQGFIGLRDFRGTLIRAFQDAGFIYHSEVCIWKDPVVAMQRTKALGLLHKTIRENSTMSRMGLPDYVVTMRKPGECEERVTHGDDLPVAMWQKYASPIWDDINQGHTLNKLPARDEKDEKHMCPLQLDVIERCIHLWTNKGDLVFSPFTGIGSEGYSAVRMGRRFVGTELKPQYWQLACQNIDDAKVETKDLFS